MLIFSVYQKVYKSSTFTMHLVTFCVSLSPERIERGASMKRYFYEEFGMESLKFEGANMEFKVETCNYS
jgi:hypothetical protein